MLNSRFFKIISFVVLQSFLAQTQAHAIGLVEDTRGLKRTQAEYYNTNPDQRLMIKVNVVGGFQSPGLYHVPDNVHLLDLISLAGGPVQNADLSKVIIKRADDVGSGYSIVVVDLNDAMSTPTAQFPALKDRDSIYAEVKAQSTAFTTVLNTLQIITMVVSLLTSSVYIYLSTKTR